MRVVHIIKAVGVSGAERHLLTLLSGLRAQGIDASLIVLVEHDKPLDDYAALLKARTIPFERIPMNRHIDLRIAGRIRERLRALQPDIVHTHLLHADFYGMIAAKRARVRRSVITRHNDDAFRRVLPMRVLHRLSWALARAGIGISESITRFCVEIEGANPNKMHTIYYGLEPSEMVDHNVTRRDLRVLLGVPPDAVVFGTVGRLIEQKGIAYALAAFAPIASENAAAHLMIVGDGALRAVLQNEARRLGIAGRVHFLGWRTDAPALMAGMDALLMPSLWEGFGLVMLEAMAARVPIIGSAVSAIPEVIADGETGLLIPPRDPEALAEAMRLLMNDVALRRHMGLMGEARAETRFTAARMVEATIKVYESAMRRR